MRNFKKFLALVLAMLMVVSAGAAVSAFDDVADDSTYAAAIADLAEKEIVRGKSADTFDPDANVTRWQMALFIVRAITGDTDDANWAEGFCYFNDIAAGQYPGAISKAAAAGIILGRTENEFDPTANVNYAEALTMAVRALGYEERDKDGKITFSYPNDYLAKAIDLGLTKGVKVADKYQALTRAETAQVIFNMIYAERNNKDLTFAEEFFGEIGVSNANTYVLVATPKQAYEGFDTVDSDLGVVVLAKLDKLGNFDGEMYVKAEDLGLTLDEAEEHIGDTVVLVNFNEKTGTFARSIIRDDETVTNANVSVKASGKITIKGRTYYVVDEYTDTKIRNEIMLYNGADLTLITDAKTLSGNYQFTLADDDQDGVYDRAIVDTIYVSVFGGWDGKKDLTSTTVWDKKTENTYSQDLEKGDVFTYTYNKATKTVNVLDTLEYTEGKLTAINTTANNKDGKYAVKLTIDDTVYTLGNFDREALGLTGANVTVAKDKTIVFANIAGKAADDKNDAVDPVITYNTTSQFLGLTLGANVRFYAIDDQIIFVANTYAAPATQNLGVIKAITTADSSAIYADIYMGGKLVTDAKIVKFLDTDFSKLSNLTFSYEIGQIFNKYKEGTVITYVENADGSYTVTDIRSAEKDFGLNELDTTSGRKFKDGIADMNAKGETIGDNARALRANSNTVFYFITDKSVKVFVGTPEDGSTLSSNVSIYADKIGYAVNKNEIAGIASVVIVTYTSADDVTGFGGVVKANEAVTSTVYVATKGTVSRVLGSEIGLTGADASANFYSYSADKLGLNMNTGAVVKNVYVRVDDGLKSVKAFEDALDAAGKDFFNVDANGIVVSIATAPNRGTLSNIEDARNISVTVGNKTYTGLTSVITVKDSNLADAKAGYEWISDLKQDVYAVQNDKTLIVLINTTADPVQPGKDEVAITVNARWRTSAADSYKAAQLTGAVDKDGAYVGQVVTVVAPFTKWNETVTSKVDAFGEKSVYVIDTVTVDGKEVKNVVLDASIKDGLLNVTFTKVAEDAFDTTSLVAGKYNVVLKNVNSNTTVEISFIVK